MLWLASYTNDALNKLESTNTADAAEVQDLVRNWKIREHLFQAIQSEVANAISAKEQWLENARVSNLPPTHGEFATIEEQYAGSDTTFDA